MSSFKSLKESTLGLNLPLTRRPKLSLADLRGGRRLLYVVEDEERSFEETVECGAGTTLSEAEHGGRRLYKN